MKFRFCIQDPTDENTPYLYEAILAAASGAVSWRGLYAFASQAGIRLLIDDPLVQKCMRDGCDVELVIGIDAVTNRQALEYLQELEGRPGSRLHPKVFWTKPTGLFHPKISDFTYQDGGRTLIVGSGNLTPGGLRTNFEGYLVLSASANEQLEAFALDEFLVRHAGDIRSIDDDALERAARNLSWPIQNIRQPEGPVVQSGTESGSKQQRTVPFDQSDRVLAARVPRAGGRWAQVHFNADVVRDFFRIVDFVSHRVYLTHVDSSGERGETEVRPCVYSQKSNKNHKIEIMAARDRPYPMSVPPVLVFLERRLRTFDYMLLMPSDDGHQQAMELTESLPSVGRGFRRVITNAKILSDHWNRCPLLASPESDQLEI